MTKWHTVKEMEKLGQIKAMAVEVDLGPDPRRNLKDPFDVYGVSERLSAKIAPILAGIALIHERQHLASTYNVGRLCRLSMQDTPVFLAAIAKLGLVKPAAELVRPHDETAYSVKMREVIVRGREVNQLLFTHHLTETGEIRLGELLGSEDDAVHAHVNPLAKLIVGAIDAPAEPFDLGR